MFQSLLPPSVSVTPTLTLLHINMTNVTKLNDSIYLMWSRQIYALLDGYAFVGHLDGSLVVPALTVVVNDTHIVNPDYILWKRQDELIFNALLGAIAKNLQPLISRATIAADIWEILRCIGIILWD